MTKPRNGTASASELQQIRQWLKNNGMSNKDAQDLVKGRERKKNRWAINKFLRYHIVDPDPQDDGGKPQ
jgi:hypothetical protein